MSEAPETYISVDVETSGPIPGEYSLLSIGACNVNLPQKTFQCQLKPSSRNSVPSAMEVTGLSLEVLARTGLAPEDAMRRFADWIQDCTRESSTPIFVGLNAPFDWSFINYYFHRYLDDNPFGFTAIDIKAMYFGATGCSWDDTRSSKMSKTLGTTMEGTHNALKDALYQAELFRLLRVRSGVS